MADVPTPEPRWVWPGRLAVDTLMTLPMGLLSSTGSADHYATLVRRTRRGRPRSTTTPGGSTTTRFAIRRRQWCPVRCRSLRCAAGSRSSRFDSGWNPGRRRARRRTMALVLRQPGRAGPPDAPRRRPAPLARRRPRPEHGTPQRPPDAPRPAAARGTRRQHRAARAPAARPAIGGVRPGPDVRVERLPGQQRARADAVDLGRSPAAVVAPRRPGRDRRSACSACRSARTCAASCRHSRPTWPA